MSGPRLLDGALLDLSKKGGSLRGSVSDDRQPVDHWTNAIELSLPAVRCCETEETDPRLPVMASMRLGIATTFDSVPFHMWYYHR